MVSCPTCTKNLEWYLLYSDWLKDKGAPENPNVLEKETNPAILRNPSDTYYICTAFAPLYFLFQQFQLTNTRFYSCPFLVL